MKRSHSTSLPQRPPGCRATSSSSVRQKKKDAARVRKLLRQKKKDAAKVRKALRLHVAKATPSRRPPCVSFLNPSFGKMIERARGDITRRSKKPRTISDLMYRDSIQGVLSALSEKSAPNLSKIVVSVAVSDGTTVIFACSGIAIECKGCVTKFLTSANLVRALTDRTKEHDNLEVQVRYEGNVIIGFLGNFDLDHDIAVVNVMSSLDVQAVHIDHVVPIELLPDSKVVAVGCGISGNLMTTWGEVTCDSRGHEDSEDLMMSTCQTSEDMEGGPLFDIEGNFVGMNLFFINEETVFIPTDIILERLKHFSMSQRRSTFLARLKNLKSCRCTGGADVSRSSKKDKRTDGPSRSREKDKRTNLTKCSKRDGRTCNGGGKTAGPLMSGNRVLLNDERFGRLDSLGYPKLEINELNDGMVLINTFEEAFGDIYDCGVWSELSKIVSSGISQNVVALASFYGETRIFACTGFFIEWNGCTTILTSASLVSYFMKDKIEKLRIEVLLPTKECREGTLEHYNLHYNVALVSVKDFCAPHPANIHHQTHDRSDKLVAVGCCFKSGVLMAERGILTHRSGRLGCNLLQHTTCKITKAAIGGPLVDFDGKIVGMNFYDMDVTGTPFLSGDVILDILAYFKTIQTVTEAGHDGYQSGVLEWTVVGDKSVRPNRWPVPEATWCLPELVDSVRTPSDQRNSLLNY